jgi:hypothetical protein
MLVVLPDARKPPHERKLPQQEFEHRELAGLSRACGSGRGRMLPLATSRQRRGLPAHSVLAEPLPHPGARR